MGPRGAFSISDPALAADSAGNVYHVSLYNPGEAQVGLGMAVSAGDGMTWTASPLEPGGDRPWVSARGEHEVFVDVGWHVYTAFVTDAHIAAPQWAVVDATPPGHPRRRAVPVRRRVRGHLRPPAGGLLHGRRGGRPVFLAQDGGPRLR